jgi:hypothetical protein
LTKAILVGMANNWNHSDNEHECQVDDGKNDGQLEPIEEWTTEYSYGLDNSHDSVKGRTYMNGLLDATVTDMVVRTVETLKS